MKQVPPLPPGAEELGRRLLSAVEFFTGWQAQWAEHPPHPASRPDERRFSEAWAEYAARLAGNYPFFHPCYAGQMLKPPHPVAAAGYLAAMLINPNNHALDGGPTTGPMEKDVVRDLAGMFHLPPETLGHLTSGGTVANLEALWVARELNPGGAVAYGEEAHYTHARMCGVLGLEGVAIAAGADGRLDLDALERELRARRVGTVVLTAGTTSLGAVDPIHEALKLRDRYGFRLHVDAAYGGFFAVLAWGESGEAPLPTAPLRAIAEADSVVVDPHKHGLQPYGCGAVLFRDPKVGRLYAHDSPYTYFTSDELHLGEISLECSRPGAAAGALWLTLRALPLRADDGLGPILRAGLRAAGAWARLIERSDILRLYQPPELDILTFYPWPAGRPAASEVDSATERLLHAGMADPEPVYLSTLRVPGERLCRRSPELQGDVREARILRSVLMKPEHELFVPTLHAGVERIARRVLAVG